MKDDAHELIQRSIAGTLSDEEALRFQEALKGDPALVDLYLSYVNLEVGLEAAAAAAEMKLPVSGLVAAEPKAGTAWPRWLPLAAAAVLVLGFGLVFWLPRTGVDEQAKSALEPAAAGFAVVTAQVDTRWGHGRGVATGELLTRETLRLEAGIAQIELFSGVNVVIEGEAEFEIVSPMEMIVTRGKVRARVPEPAQGFRIRTTEGDVVDLGTEFALNVTEASSEMHVLDGEVEWHPRTAPMRRVVGGEALQWKTDGEATAMAADQAAFAGTAEMKVRLNAARVERREDWAAFGGKLRQDPGLVAYFQVGASEPDSRVLPNGSVAGADRVQEGAIVSGARVADRWGTQGGALDFSPTGSRVRVNVSGAYRSLTLFTWVKINSLDRWYNSLFLTDGAAVNEPHWQIMDDGRLYFSVKKRERRETKPGKNDKHHFYSPPFWNASLSGQWLMIATVYDVDARKVTHFLNGRVLSEEAVPDGYLVEKVTIGAASIGNWSEPVRDDPHFAVRNLNGSMDEFALFSRALSPQEIEKIYQHGKP